MTEAFGLAPAEPFQTSQKQGVSVPVRMGGIDTMVLLCIHLQRAADL